MNITLHAKNGGYVRNADNHTLVGLIDLGAQLINPSAVVHVLKKLPTPAGSGDTESQQNTLTNCKIELVGVVSFAVARADWL